MAHMSESKTPDSSGSQPPATAAAATPGAASSPAQAPADDAVSGLERAGTVLMAVAVGTVIVILLDFAFKGRILGPLFARLPAPAAATAAADQDQDDGDAAA